MWEGGVVTGLGWHWYLGQIVGNLNTGWWVGVFVSLVMSLHASQEGLLMYDVSNVGGV